MKKLNFSALLLAVALAPIPTATITANAETNYKAAYVCEYTSGIAAYEQNATERLPIASMCKIMTLLLSFEAIDGGDLSYDEKISVSGNASGMGGSQVFLEKGLQYTASDLLKTIAVCSANDSCVAMAERIAGSEAAFVDKMNVRAKELGAENTLFANCTGLPKEPQYSCARDVALMLRALLSHEKYFEYAHIWLEDFAHPDGRTTRITNTNRLIREYDGCDGGKTGFTNQAGFCLAATAKRGDMRLITVVIAADSSKARFAGVSALLNETFANYENKLVAEAGKPLDIKLKVNGSRQKVTVTPEKTLAIFQKRGTAGEVRAEYTLSENKKAPLFKGEEVGKATLYLNDIEQDSCKLLALEDAERFRWADAYREAAQNWNGMME